MLLLTLFILCLGWLVIAGMFNRFNVLDSDWTGGIVFSLIVGFVLLIAIVIANGTAYTSISKTKETIVCLQKQKQIYTEKKEVLYFQYANMLDTVYGGYEKKIFDKITEKKFGSKISVDVYPMLKYSSTLIELSKRLQELTDAVYECDLKIESEKAWLRFMTHNPWILNWFMDKKLYQ